MSRPKTHSRMSDTGEPPSGFTVPPEADSDEAEAEQLGRIIDGRYQLLELIGRGGMGSVYKAEHQGIRRIVALKLLHPGLAQLPEVSRRFEREAFAIGRIEHPNCVNVSDFGQLDDGSLYLVLEYLEGRSLGDELAEKRRLQPERALHILRHVLCGLGHAHDNDIVHRDVKPENVLLVTQGDDPDFAKILDFGIAKLVGSAAADDGDVKLTQAGMAFGTPVYMSPEQAVGNPVTGQADLYAASVMAYEMITGKPPFYSEDKLEIMSMHTSKPVPPMSEVAPGVNVAPEIEAVILRGLAKRPRERYADAAEYIEAIDAVLGRAPSAPSSVKVVKSMGTVPVVYGGLAMATTPVLPPQAVQDADSLEDAAFDEKAGKHPWWRRKRVLMLAAGLAGIALLAGVIFRLLDSGSVAEKAAEKLGSGDPKGAIALLETKKDVIAEDADAQFQLGRAYSLAREDEKALIAYGKALELNPELAKDGELRGYLSVLQDSSKPLLAAEALDLVARYLNDTAATDKLVEMASQSKHQKARHLAIDAASALGAGDRIDWVQANILDLEQLEGCANRREVVRKLRALEDPRAIPALKKAAYRKGRQGKWKGKPINRCLRNEALDAAEHLQSKQTEKAELPVPVE